MLLVGIVLLDFDLKTDSSNVAFLSVFISSLTSTVVSLSIISTFSEYDFDFSSISISFSTSVVLSIPPVFSEYDVPDLVLVPLLSDSAAIASLSIATIPGTIGSIILFLVI